MADVSFQSLADLVDYARGADVCPNAAALPRSSLSTINDFYGVPLAQAFDLATHGWPEGAAKIKTILDSAPERPARKKRIAWHPGTSGGPVDIGRYLQGHPDCFMRPVYSAPARGQRIIKIGFGEYNAKLSHDDIFQRGAAACALVDRLEDSGYRVELVYCCEAYTSSRAHLWQADCTIKHEHEPLDIDLIAFALANPAMARRILRACAERETPDVRKLCGFYEGSTYGYSGIPLGDFDLIIRGDNWSESSLAQWLAQLGITTEGAAA